MSYAIGNVVYGFPVTEANFLNKLSELDIEKVIEGDEEFFEENFEDDLDELTSDGLRDWFDADETMFEKEYTGNADETPMWFGVKLDTIDETKHVKLDELNTKPTKEQEAELRERWNKLPSFVRDILKEQTFSVYIIWSTS